MNITRFNPSTMPYSTNYLLQGYTMTVTAGNTIYTAGQVGQDLDRRISGGANIETQIRQTWQNLEGALGTSGASLKDVARVTTWVTDIAALAPWFRIWNELYRPEERPASTFVEIPRLARAGLLVEIQAIGSLDPIERFNPSGVPGRPYSGVVKNGDTVYVAGQASIDQNAKTVGAGDIRAQIRQTWLNIEAGMKAVGGSLKDIVKVSTFATDVMAVAPWLDVWQELYGPGEAPASTFVEVPRLARPGLMIEIEAIGYLGKDVERVKPTTMAQNVPYSQVVRAGDTVYVSGQLAYDSNTDLVGHGDIQAQLTQVWHNIELAMEAVGGSIDKVVNVTDYVTEIVTLSNFYEAWNKVFTQETRPGSSFIEVPRLDYAGAMVNVEAIGFLG